MQLEKNMYVRTNLGIAKIISVEKKHLGNEFILDKEIIDTHEDYYTNCMYDYRFYLEQIIKTSHNIIDLIEEGDYVNGKEVSSLQRYDDGTVADIRFYEEVEMQEYSFGEESDIKSIVTKEQFEQMEYKVGE